MVSSIQDIPLAKIRESKTNPRRFFDKRSWRNWPTTSDNTACRTLSVFGHVRGCTYLCREEWRLDAASAEFALQGRNNHS